MRHAAARAMPFIATRRQRFSPLRDVYNMIQNKKRRCHAAAMMFILSAYALRYVYADVATPRWRGGR